MAATRGEMFAGVTVAIITPFKNGEVDWDDLGKLVDWHCEQGTDAPRSCGTTGESPTLTHEENEPRRRRSSASAPRAHEGDGRHRVELDRRSDPHDEGREAGRRQRHAAVGPYYNKPSQEGYFRHFTAVAEACDLPVVIYNIPGRTGSNILPETIARMAEKSPQIVAVKEATGSLDQASQIAALCDITILSATTASRSRS